MVARAEDTDVQNKLKKKNKDLSEAMEELQVKICCGLVIKNSTQLSMKFFLLINVKMPTVVGILTFMSRKNSIIDLSEPRKAEFLDIFILMTI